MRSPLSTIFEHSAQFKCGFNFVRYKYQDIVVNVDLSQDVKIIFIFLKRQMVYKVDTKRVNENDKIIEKGVKFDPKKYLNIKKRSN